tara:strand:+ start:439 stop:1488 length:1050 start_codon:yes stop_codon:yes gene_type:complete
MLIKNKVILVLAIGFILPTMVKANEKLIKSVAFGSCLKQTRPQPIWDSVFLAKPDVFVLLGDNIYGDTRDMEILKNKWNTFSAISNFQKVRSSSYLLGIWDDHDYGENDAGNEYPRKAESQQIFLDFLGEPKDSDRRKTPGIYDSVTLGPDGKRIQFILLDTRYFRTPLKRAVQRERGKGPYEPNISEGAEILGEVQWEWLAKTLDEPAEIRIVASSIQILSTSHGWETWGNFPKERERLLALLKKTNKAGTLIISGDRHSAEISKLEGILPHPILDITSSAMNQRQKPNEEKNPLRVGERYFNENFGLLEIDWTGKSPSILASIRSLSGEVISEYKLENLLSKKINYR